MLTTSLTQHQRAMLDGEHGWPQQIGMRLLTAVARAFDADSLIPVESVHLSLSGVSVGRSGLALFTKLADRGGTFVVPTTLNVLSIDRRATGRDSTLHADEGVQQAILAACQRMGALSTCSCNPFLLGDVPAFGTSVAWNESATAPYVNGVLGARTNREGATALASALTGYTANYGMHLEPNRRGAALVDVRATLHGIDDFALLGGAVGRACGSRIPVIRGIATPPTLDELTVFCAALAALGPLAMFHLSGVTPEAAIAEAALVAARVTPMCIDRGMLVEERLRYTTATGDRVDVVAIGCPHASLQQIREVADLVGSRRVSTDTKFLLQTNVAIAQRAHEEGLTERLEHARVDLTTDTCVHVSYRQPPPGSVLATNSLKIAYLTASHDIGVRFGTLQDCVRSAIAGRWIAAE